MTVRKSEHPPIVRRDAEITRLLKADVETEMRDDDTLKELEQLRDEQRKSLAGKSY